LIHDFAEGVVKLNPECEKFEPEFLKNFLAEVYANCSKELPWTDAIKQSCGQSMVGYRALRLYQYNKDRNVKDLRNEELIQNIIALISSNAISDPEGAAALLASALELKERWPDSAPAAKSVALAEFLSMNGNFRDPAAANLDRVLAAVQDARRLDSKDWQTFELEMFLKHQQNPEQSFGDIARFAAQNPQSPIAFYYLGWSLWNQQNAQGAKGALDKALSLEPNNSRFQETRRKMDTASFSDPIFSIQVGIGFDDL